MNIDTLLKYVIAVCAVGLVISIVLQNRSGGLGSVFGGGGGEAYRSKRGLEGFLYNATIVLAVVISVASILLAIHLS